MGAWGEGPFESDQALDWVSDISHGTLAKLTEALTVIENLKPEEIDLDPAASAQAAAFMFVTLIGHESRVLEPMNEEAVAFTTAAIAALEKINASPHADDWREPDVYRAANQALIEKLTAIQADPDQAIVGTTLMGKILSGEHG